MFHLLQQWYRHLLARKPGHTAGRRRSSYRLACERLENRLQLSTAAFPGLGDINGDGFGDLAIGAPDGAAGGEVNVLYGSAAVSTGQIIVFTAGLDFPEVGNLGQERGGIYTVRPNGTDLRQLTSFQTSGFSFGGDGLILSDDHPSFSPDGTHIIFTSNRDAENLSVPVFEQDFEIYRMTAAGTNVVRLTTSPGVDTEPVYSPDGTKIAFASARSGN